MTNTIQINNDLKLIIKCPHCDKPTEQKWNMIYPSWYCKKHGRVYCFNKNTLFRIDN